MWRKLLGCFISTFSEFFKSFANFSRQEVPCFDVPETNIRINFATVKELKQLPRVGDTVARLILSPTRSMISVRRG